MSASTALRSSDADTRSIMPPSDFPTASGSSDPASSLRAAALLTLKSKRRKPTDQSTTQTLPLRPPPPSDASFQLDYGQEDITSPQVVSKSPNLYSKPPPPTDAIELREEGEISDEEITQPATDLQHDLAISVPPVIEPVGRFASPRSASSMVESSPPRLKPFERKVAAAPSLYSGKDEPMVIDPLPISDLPLHLIDTDHVRPGLPLNQEQYDTAKDLVLDLLGWGVPPEYFVACGLTREIIFYVFGELNLRLPQNLDVSGLIPYTPEIKASVEHHLSSSMPPPAVPLDRQLPQGNANLASSSHLQPHESEPAVPASLISSKNSLNPMSPSAETSQAPTANNLHDMEQQRRQELLARKAVIASRKSKPPASNSSPEPSNFTEAPEVDMEIATETVDDFLKTIEPQSDASHAVEESSFFDVRERQPHTTDIDVDEIPGLGQTRSTHDMSNQTLDHDFVALPSSPGSHSQPQIDYPSSSTETTTTTFDTPALASDLSFTSENQNPQRRGTKRPVASDFVDFETGTRPHSGASGGHSNGVVHIHPQTRHRLNTGFASVSGMRRCIIDLSDSEGEGDESVFSHEIQERDRWGGRSGYLSPAPTRPTSITFNASGGWPTPPVSTAATPAIPASGSTLSPAALMEKEIEIRRMKELIAQREQSRLKKAASARAVVNIDTNGSTVSSTSQVVKSEDRNHSPSPPTPIHESGRVELTNGHQHTSPHPSEPNNTSNIASYTAFPPSKSDINSSDLNALIGDSTNPGEQVLTAEGRQEQAVSNVTSSEDTEMQQMNGTPEGSSVDVDQSTSSSAQAPPKITARRRLDESPDLSMDLSATRPEIHHDQDFATYNSLFQRYPLLASHSRSLFSNIDNDAGLQVSSSLIRSLSFVSTAPTSSSSLDSLNFSSSSSVLSSPPAYSFRTSPFPVLNLKPLKLATESKLLDPSKRICQYEVPGGGVCRDEGCDDIHLSRDAGYGTNRLEPSDQDTYEYLANVLPSWLVEHNMTLSKISSALEQVRTKHPQMAFEERVAQALTMFGSSTTPAPTPK